MTRFTVLTREELDAEQRKVYEEVEKAGGPLGGPYWAYIRNPKFMRLSQDMGDYLRTSKLSNRERQIVVLTVVRFWNAKYPWAVQVGRSLAAGLDQAAIDAINARQAPKLADAREKAAYEVSRELLERKGLSDATYAAAEKALGLAQLVDVVSCVGYFSMMSCTSNAFDIDPPQGQPARLAT
jgi:4-carboxymuconolactone decarboxylase